MNEGQHNTTPTTYAVRFTRTGPDGARTMIEFEGYGLLQECLDDVVEHAEKRGWFKDEERETSECRVAKLEVSNGA